MQATETSTDQPRDNSTPAERLLTVIDHATAASGCCRRCSTIVAKSHHGYS